MTNTYETKRAFKKRLGLFDKDVAIEELDEQVRMEEEAERILIELDERHERELEEQWEEDYEEREMERRLEEAEIERQIEEQEQYRVGKRWEDFSIAEIEKEYKQRLLEEASEKQGTLMTNILVSDEPITSKMPLEKPLPSWEDAVKIIQTLVDEREDYGEGNKIIKQAWERILRG